MALAAGVIPESIQLAAGVGTLTPTTQITVVPGLSQFTSPVAAGIPNKVTAAYYRFSADFPAGTGSIAVSTSQPTNVVDVALALYDADGNLLAKADADRFVLAGTGRELLGMTVRSATSYVLGVFTQNQSPGASTLPVSLLSQPQRMAPTITVDAASGSATVVAAGDGRLEAAADVSYFPLDLLAVGQKETVTVSPAPAGNAAAGFFGQIYSRTTAADPWKPLAAKSGTSFSFDLTAPAGLNLTDVDYLLAVSTPNHATAPQGFQVGIAPPVSTQAPVVPAKVLGLGQDLGFLLPMLPGSASATRTFAQAGGSITTVRALADGPLEIAVAAAGGYDKAGLAVGVYDAASQAVVAVVSRTTPGRLVLPITATKGTRYIILAKPLAPAAAGSCTLTCSQSYTPKPADLVTAVDALTAVTGLPLDPAAGGRLLRVMPTPGAGVLVLNLRADAAAQGTPRLWITRAGGTTYESKSVDTILDLSQESGPFDVFITGTGAGTATLKTRAAVIPQKIVPGKLVPLDLAQGGLSQSFPGQPFGGVAGSSLRFYEPSPGIKETLRAASPGPVALLHYVQQGDAFVLDGWNVSPDGAQPASITRTMSGKTMVGAAAMSLAVDGPRDLTVSVGTPAPQAAQPRQGVGVSMVPNVDNPRQAILQIRRVPLETVEERDLWQTSLPANLDSSGQHEVTFAPTSPDQPLAVRLSVLDAKNKLLTSAISQPGQKLSIPLAGLFSGKPPQLLAGGLVRFLVEPLSGTDIGDGLYDLKMTVSTGNLFPYLVTEQKFYPQSLDPKAKVKPALPRSGEPQQVLEEGCLPLATTITEVKLQGTSFIGSATGNFSSKDPYYASVGVPALLVGNPGAINVFKIVLPKTGKIPAFSVSTSALPGSTVNTNIGLYVANYFDKDVPNRVGAKIVSYDMVPNVPPSFDFDPAGRKPVDAKITVSNPSCFDSDVFTNKNADSQKRVYLPADGSRTLYVFVKNEQGTKGGYTLDVKPVVPQHVGPWEADPFQIAGPARTIALDPLAGTSLDRMLNKTSVSVNAATFSFRLATPRTFVTGSGLSLTAAVPKTLLSTNADSLVIDVSDAAGKPLYTRSFPLGLQTTVTAALADAAHPFAAGSSYCIGLKVVSGASRQARPISTISLSAPVAAAVAVDAKDPLGQSVFPYPTGATLPESFRFLVPAPDGTLHAPLQPQSPAKAGIRDKSLFVVEHAGQATFTLHTTGLGAGTVALYRANLNHVVAGDENGTDFQIGTIVDVASFPAQAADVSFTDYVTPGAYYLRVAAAKTSLAASYDIAIPAYDAIDIPLNPDDGDNSQRIRETIDANTGRLDASYYRIKTLPGTLGRWQIKIESQSPVVNSRESPVEQFAVYRKTAFGGFESVATTLIPPDANLPPEDRFYVLAPAPGEEAAPDEEYYLGHVTGLVADAAILGPKFEVPQSGDPDLKTDVFLEPGGGFTRARIVVRNVGFAGSSDCESKLFVSNNTTKEATHKLDAIGAQGSIDESFVWMPDAPPDNVAYAANSNQAFKERTLANNDDKAVLASVDAAVPTVAIGLDDPLLAGEAVPGLWGRYISGVPNVNLDIRVKGVDASNDLYQITSYRTIGLYQKVYNETTLPCEELGTGSDDVAYRLDAGSVPETTPGEPNEIHYEAIDQFGLRSGEKVQRLDVVKRPTVWSRNYDAKGEKLYLPETLIAWNQATKRYDIGIDYDVAHYQQTVAQVLGANVPFIGDKRNRFIANISGSGSASLDPTAPISVPLSVHLVLEAVGQSVFDETYSGTQQIDDNTTVAVAPIVDGRSVDIVGGSVSLQMRDKDLFDKSFPKIPVFAIGIPGVASFSINIGFGISAALSAGVKVGMLVNPFDVGLMVPTFVKPSVTPRAEISGDVQFLGFDLGSVAGQFKLEIAVTAGLKDVDPPNAPKPDYTEVVSFQDLKKLGERFGFALDITPKLSAKASVLGFTVWESGDADLAHVTIGDTITTDDIGAPALQPAAPLPGAAAEDKHAKTYILADAPFNPADVDAAPQLVVERTGNSLIDAIMAFETPRPVDPADATKGNRSNLRVLTRNRQSGAWAAPLDLPGGDVSNPALALTHDAGGQAGAVVVYEKLVGYDSRTQAQSFRNALTHTEVVSRYFDGTTWAAEQPLTPTDGRFDMQPTVAFNGTGAGVAAWMHGATTDPFSADGKSFLRNTQDIQAAVWLPATHAWSAPVTLSAAGDAVADSRPASYVDAAGNAYVVWVRGDAGANTLWYARYDAAAKKWSAAANLPVAGLPAGTIDGLAIGADKAGRIDTIFSLRALNADGSSYSGLYNRPAPAAAFGVATAYEPISTAPANFMHLRTTTAPDGSLVVSWQQNTGADDGVYAAELARLSPASAGVPWTKPVKLSSTAAAARNPVVAVESDGTLQVVYGNREYPALKDEPAVPSALAGKTITGVTGLSESRVATASFAPLPELTFTRPLSFGGDAAPTGTTATGMATIANTGLAPDTVTIGWYRNTTSTGAGGVLVGTKTVTLAPGASYDLAAPFTAQAGPTSYAVRVSGTKGQAISTADDSTVASLTGKADLSARSLAFASLPVPGVSQTLSATIDNRAQAAVGPFKVALYAGDPTQPQSNPVLVQQPLLVPGIAAGKSLDVSFPNVKMPTTGGRFVYTLVVDSENAIAEVTDANNRATAEGRFRTDPAIAFGPDGQALIKATVIDGSGIDNVVVDAMVANRGDVPLANLKVNLYAGRNDSLPKLVGTKTVPMLAAGQSLPVRFMTSGLDGDMHYRVSLDDSSIVNDDNLSNDTGTTLLPVHGMADLKIGTLLLGSSQLQQGKPLVLSTTISNAGIADARGALVEVYAIGNGSIGNGSIGQGSGAQYRVASAFVDVDALSSAPITLSLDTKKLLGTYTFVVRVNRFHKVLESDETNNTASLSQLVFGPSP